MKELWNQREAPVHDFTPIPAASSSCFHPVTSCLFGWSRYTGGWSTRRSPFPLNLDSKTLTKLKLRVVCAVCRGTGCCLEIISVPMYKAWGPMVEARNVASLQVWPYFQAYFQFWEPRPPLGHHPSRASTAGGLELVKKALWPRCPCSMAKWAPPSSTSQRIFIT